VNWEAVGAIGEVVSAIGVVVTLVYLAVQIRQNSAVVRASTRQAISTTQAEVGFRLAENSELLDLVVQLTSIADSVPIDQLRGVFFLRGLMRTYENQYHQYQDGTFDASIWSGYLHNMSQTFASQATRDFWAANRALYSSDFAEFVDSNLFDGGNTAPAA
jgi:hypothetical protein